MQTRKSAFIIFVYMAVTSLLGWVSAGNTNCNATESWLVPQQLDTAILVTAVELAAYIPSSPPTENDVQFLLFTSGNPTEPNKIPINDPSALASAQFNPDHDLYLIIHGWLNDGNSYMCKTLTKAAIARNNTNVIVVDWGKAAMTANYMSAAKSVEAVGRIVAAFLDSLCNNFSTVCNKFKIIGHSLGAHVAGFTGKKYVLGSILYVLGLDPAQPLFDYCYPDKRLCKDDAVYVEIMHTNTETLGFKRPIGHASFYPNGGKSQRGCELDPYCSHMKSIDFCAQAFVEKKYPSIECATYTDATNNACGTTLSPALMAWPTNNNISGVYYVPMSEEAGFNDSLTYFIIDQIL